MSKEREILKAILDCINNGEVLSFSEDMGDNTLTMEKRLAMRIEDNGHTHCGFPDATFDELVDSLHDSLVKGKGVR